MFDNSKHIELVREHIKAFSAKKWDLYRKPLVDDCLYNEPATHRSVEGVDAVVKALEMWTLAFPDLKGTVKNVVAHEDLVVAEILWEGTHKGYLKAPFGEIPPTNKIGRLEAVEIFRFRGEKIAEMRHYFDLMTILNQIGVPAPELVPTP
jgi:steroid delta-isomerase-like uncharacterized protein